MLPNLFIHSFLPFFLLPPCLSQMVTTTQKWQWSNHSFHFRSYNFKYLKLFWGLFLLESQGSLFFPQEFRKYLKQFRRTSAVLDIAQSFQQSKKICEQNFHQSRERFERICLKISRILRRIIKINKRTPE